MRIALVAAVVLLGCGAPRTPDAAEPAPPPAPTAHAIVAPQAPLPRDLVVRFGEAEPPPPVDPSTLLVFVDPTQIRAGVVISVFRADTYDPRPADQKLDFSFACAWSFSADEYHHVRADGSTLPFDDLAAGDHVVELWDLDALDIGVESGPLRVVRVTLQRGENVLTVE